MVPRSNYERPGSAMRAYFHWIRQDKASMTSLLRWRIVTSSIYGNRSYESTVRWGPVNGTSAGKRRNLYPGSLHSLFVLLDVHSCQLVPMLSQRASTMTSQCSSSTTVQRALTSIHDGQLALGQLAFMIINVRLFRLDEHPSPDQ